MGVISDTILTHTFLTGSRAFGTHSKASDFDLVVPVVYWDDITSNLQKLMADNKRESTYFQGVKYYWYIPQARQITGWDSVELNLMPMHGASVKAWYLATLAMAASSKDAKFSHPQKKYATFEAMVAAFKAVTFNPGPADWEESAIKVCESARSNSLLQPGYTQLRLWLAILEGPREPKLEIEF